jgi:hypothetical protein
LWRGLAGVGVNAHAGATAEHEVQRLHELRLGLAVDIEDCPRCKGSVVLKLVLLLQVSGSQSVVLFEG